MPAASPSNYPPDEPIIVRFRMPSTGRNNPHAFARSTAAHSTMTYHDTSSCQFVELSAMKRLLQGAPVVRDAANVQSYREVVARGDLLTAWHDGYLARFGVVHRRVLMIAHDGGRLGGEDTVSPAPGLESRAPTPICRTVSPASRGESEPPQRWARRHAGIADREVWTFEALDDKVDIEDSVFLAGNDGPRRTAQIVIRQDRGTPPRSAGVSCARPRRPATRARRIAKREPELPIQWHEPEPFRFPRHRCFMPPSRFAVPSEVPGLAARRIAADILDGVLHKHRTLDDQLDGAGAHPGLKTLADRDRALMRRLVATILRRLGTLGHLLSRLLDRGIPTERPARRARS